MKRFSTQPRSLKIMVGLLPVVFLVLSCGNPLDRQLLLHVKDSIAPEITVICPTDGSCYASAVLVSGTVFDSSESQGDDQGSVTSLFYEVLASSIKGQASVVDGAFSFVFSAESLSGNITLLLTATDWNRNQSTMYISLVAGGSDIPSFAATPDNRKITLDWDPIPGAETYTLYYTRDGTYPNLPAGDNGFVLTDVQPGLILDTYRHDGDPGATERVKNGDLHVLRLRAQFPAGSGLPDSWSDFEKALPLSRLTLAPKASKDQSGEIDLWWYDVPAGVGYLLYRSADKAGPYYQLTGVLQEARYADRAVSEGVSYYYKVKPETHSEVESYAVPGKAQTLEFSARIGGLDLGSDPCAITVAGAKAYVATREEGLTVVDVSEPGSPTTLGSCDFGGATPMSITGIALAGDYAYVAAHDKPLYVIGIDPGSPAEYLEVVQSYKQDLPASPSKTDAKDVAVANGHAFATNYDTLFVYDAANPGSTTFESKFYLQSYLDYAKHMFVETLDATHCRAYICGIYTGKRGLAIVDVNLSVNPATFTYRGTYSMDTAANMVHVLGDYAYVATGQGIQVLDVTDPTAPSLCCTFESGKSVTDLTIVGDTLYAMVNNKGLYRYGIPDPVDPGTIDLQRVYDEVIDGCFAVSGDHAYVSNPLEGQGGLSIVYVGDELFDFSDRPYLEYGEYGNYQNIADFEVCDDLVYAAIRAQGLETIRVVPPATYQRLGSDDIPSVGGKVGVKVVGDRAFLADSAYGLHVLDVTDPSTPTEIGGLPATFRSRQDWMQFCQVGLEIVGDYVFLPDFDGGILVADVSDPQDIAKLHVIPMISNTFEVVAQGTVLYAAAYTSGLHAFDITVPDNPHKLSTYYEGGDAMGLDVEDETVYLAAFDRSVDIIDYSTPAQPAIVGRYDWPIAINWGWIVAAIDVDKVGSYAFVSQFEVGVAAIDVSDPIRPYLQGSWQTPPGDFYQRKTSTAYVSDGFIYAGGIRDDSLKPVLATYRIQVRE